jgi:hypothetical protein
MHVCLRVIARMSQIWTGNKNAAKGIIPTPALQCASRLYNRTTIQ